MWSTAPIEEPAPAELQAGGDLVLRQVVRLSNGAETVRIRLSNEYGSESLVLEDVTLARAGADGSIVAGTSQTVRFSGGMRAEVPPHSVLFSDPLPFRAAAHEDLAVTTRLVSLPGRVAGHPGSRTTSFLKPGASTSDGALADAARIVHWYFVSGVESLTRRPADAAVACLGDSITDGYGCQPDQNLRWTDAYSRRLRADPATAGISVLNLGIGGGRLLRQGNGPSGLSRLERDVFGQAGVKWVVVQLGVNDLGTRIKARAAGQAFAGAGDLIDGYQKVLSACRQHGVRVVLATITPFAGAGWYSTLDIEADRQAVNRWIRERAPCDAVADFDAALRDPDHPTLLLPGYDSGDHLHPSMAGYRRMAESVPEGFLLDAQDLARPHAL